MEHRLPFPVSTRKWDTLTDWERSFFIGDDYLPLHPNHAEQIRLLEHDDAFRVDNWFSSNYPAGWPEHSQFRYPHEESISLDGCWDDGAGSARVRDWLFGRGIPFGRTVYLLYERDRVVAATWRMVVRYWDAFATSVGYAMLAFDHTRQWTGCFHHEDVIVFGSYCPFRPAEPDADE